MSEANRIKILRALDGPLRPAGGSWDVYPEAVAEHVRLPHQDVGDAIGILASQGLVEVLQTNGDSPELGCSAVGITPDGRLYLEGVEDEPARGDAVQQDVVFISWSGEESKAVARAVKLLVETTLPGVRTFFSPDIPKGTAWAHEIQRGLEQSNFGIVCLAGSDAASEWVTFEAGAIFNAVSGSRVAPVLVGVEPRDVPAPLSMFQCTRFDREDVFSLLESVNDKTVQREYRKLRSAFEATWPGFEQSVRDRPRPARPDQAAADDREEGALSEDAVRVLQRMSSSNLPLVDSLLVQDLRLSPQRVRLYVDELRDAGLVADSVDGRRRVTPEGRRFLDRKGLLD